jgi:hypothetical protein
MPHAPGHRPQLTTGFAPGFANVLPDQSLAPTAHPSPKPDNAGLSEEEIEQIEFLLKRGVPEESIERAYGIKFEPGSSGVIDEHLSDQEILPRQPEPGVIGSALSSVGSKIVGGEEFLNYALTNPRLLQAVGSMSDQPQLLTPGEIQKRELQIQAAEAQESISPAFGDAPGTAIRSGIEGTVEDLTGSERAGKIAGYGFDVGAAPLTFAFALTPNLNIGKWGFLGVRGAFPKATGKITNTISKNPTVRKFVNKTGSLPTAKVTSNIPTQQLTKPIQFGGKVIKKAGQTVKVLTDPVIGGGNIAQRYAAETIVGTAAEAGYAEGGIGGGLLGAAGSAIALSKGRTGSIPGAPQAVKQVIRKGTQKIVGKPAATGTAPAAARRAEEMIADPEGVAKQAEVEAYDEWTPTHEGEIPPVQSKGTREVTDLTAPQAIRQHKNFERVIGKEVTASMRVVRSQIDRITEVFKKFTTTDSDGYEKVIVKNPDGTSEEEYLGKVVEFFDDPKYTVESLGEPVFNAIGKMYDLLDDAQKILNEHGIDFTGGVPAPLEGVQRFFPRRIKDYKKGVDPDSASDLELQNAIDASKDIESIEEARSIFANIPKGGELPNGKTVSQIYERVFDTFQDGVDGSKKTIDENRRSAWVYDTPVNSLFRFIREHFDDLEKLEITRNAESYAQPKPELIRTIEESLLDPEQRKLLTPEELKQYENLVYKIDAARAIRDIMYPELKDKALIDQGKKVIKISAGGIANNRFAKRIRKYNRFIRPIQSTADFSGPLVTLGMAAAVPGYGTRMFAKEFNKKVGDTLVGKQYIDEFFNDPQVRRIEKYVTLIDPKGDPGKLKEFIVTAQGNKAQRVLGKAAAPFNRNFAMMGNRLRTYMFNILESQYRQDVINSMVDKGVALKDIDVNSIMTEDVLVSIGKSVDRFTGIGTGKVTDLEDLSLFAPNFYRSIFETISKNFEAGTLDGDLARDFLQTAVSSGTFLAASVAIAQGRDVSEVLNPFDWKQLYYNDRLILNPNFLTMRTPIKAMIEKAAELNIPGVDPAFEYVADHLPDSVGTRDVHVFGAFDSMARLLATFTDLGLVIAFGDEGYDKEQRAVQDVLYGDYTKGSPGFKMLGYAGSGKTFEGDPFLSLDSDAENQWDRLSLGRNDTWKSIIMKNLANIGTRQLPFTGQQAIREAKDLMEAARWDTTLKAADIALGSVFSGLYSASGAKENPLSMSEIRNELALDTFGRQYGELTPPEKQELYESEPKLTKENFFQAPTDPEGKFYLWMKTNNNPRFLKELSDLDKARKKGMSPKAFRLAVQDRTVEKFQRTQNKREELGIKDKFIEQERAASVIPVFYQIMDNVIDVNTNDINFADFDEQVALLKLDIKNGFYGDPNRAMQFLNERTVQSFPKELLWYYNNKNTIAEATANGGWDKKRNVRYTYWEQKQRAFDKYRAKINEKIGGNTTRTYNEALKEYYRMKAAERDPSLIESTPKYKNAADLAGLLQKIQDLTNTYRKRMREHKDNPFLKDALIENGYLEK